MIPFPPSTTPPRLDLEAAGPTEPEARLTDFVWSGPTPDLALHGAGRDWWLTRSRFDGAQRWVETFELEAGEVVPRDRARWDIDAERFAETGRWVGDGPNQHRRATVLPTVMRVGEGALPIPGARVTLAWVGPATLRSGPHEVTWRCLRLVIEQGGLRMEQWLAEGVGEIAVGPAYGPFGRWIVGWRGGDRTLLHEFGAVDLGEVTLDEDGAPDVGVRA
jgi:hypothetical protein